ncbi:MAG: hypothetical protein HYR89_03345 [Actinobacteria bacterium]|nr:hypothetical protein [Actinomycetota bacterium]
MTATDHLATVENACALLESTGEPVTFTAVAEQTGISRTTLYRNTDIRAVIEEHRAHTQTPRTISGLTAEIGHLRVALEAIADRVRAQEERLRHLERRQKQHRKTN